LWYGSNESAIFNPWYKSRPLTEKRCLSIFPDLTLRGKQATACPD
jgi:hypothetical protein